MLPIGLAAQSNTQGSAETGAQTDVHASPQGAQASGSGATSTSASTHSGKNSASVSSGTTVNAELNTPIDSKKAKPGDPVVAHTTEPAKADGKTVLPRGTKILGHVTQASSRTNGETQSALGIIFDKAVLKNGQEVPMSMAIQAIAQSKTVAAGSDESLADNPTNTAVTSSRAGSAGALGGVTSTAETGVGTVTNTAARTTDVPVGAVEASTNVAGNAVANGTGGVRNGSGGLNAAGQLASSSSGVFGLKGLSLDSSASNSSAGSVITSTGKNIHLDSGTRLLLVTQGAAQAAPAGGRP
ncbi:MAG: hypothetical protein NVS9B4_15550 [Candidatus Acidiferrum sp.]